MSFCTALHMSYTVSVGALTAVSAPISTPVYPALEANAVISMHLSQPLNSLTASVTARTIPSISPSELYFTRLSLSEPWASEYGSPTARRTWLGLTEPNAHAEPLDAAMPLRSSVKMRDCPSMPSKDMFGVPGSRGTLPPFICESGIFSSSVCILSRIDARRKVLSSRSSIVSEKAAAPTIPATFSVPARCPRSCSPPALRLSRRRTHFARLLSPCAHRAQACIVSMRCRTPRGDTAALPPAPRLTGASSLRCLRISCPCHAYHQFVTELTYILFLKMAKITDIPSKPTIAKVS